MPSKLPKAALRALLASSALLLVLSLWHSSLPVFGPITYQYEGRASRTGALPLSVPTASEKLHIRTTVRVGWVHPSLFTVVPDDCLERLVINGSEVPFRRPICYQSGGGSVYLARRLSPGINTIEMDVIDGGGKGGLRMGVSLRDPVLLRFAAVAFLVALAGAVSLIRLSARPRVGYAALLVVVAATAVRLPLLRLPGYPADVALLAGWAKSAVELGVGASYLRQVGTVALPNYPPLSLDVLAAAGRAYRWLVDPVFDASLPDFAAFLKLPAIAADALTAALWFLIVRRLRGGRLGAAFAAGLAYALNPAVIYESAVWGQIDSVFCFLALASLAAGATRRFRLAGALAALALLTKLQAFVILPTLALLFVLERGASRRAVLGGAAATLVTLLPIGSLPALRAIQGVYLHSAGYFPVLSMEAYNLWIALFGPAEQLRSDRAMVLGVASYRDIGLALFGAFAVGLPLLSWGKFRSALAAPRRASAVFLVPAMTTYAFFLFNTEMHERYLFPMMAFGVPLLFISRAGRYVYVASAVLFSLNLLGSLPWTRFDRGLYRGLPNLPMALGACHLLVFAAGARVLRGKA